MEKHATCKEKKIKVKANIHAYWRDKNGNLLREDHVKNIVTYVGLEKLLKKAAGETVDDALINKAALGTGDNTPATSDIALETEVYRNNVISATASDNQLFIDALFDQGEVDGTFTEFGLFVDGDAGANTGELWNRVLVNWEKSTEESLFVRCSFTFTNG